jgi:rubrerythrin
LAERETDTQRSKALHTLADAEQRHADLRAGRHSALGGSLLTYEGPKTGEADNLANRIGGINMALRRPELDETQDIAKYAKQLEDIGDQPSIDILGQVPKDEREHYQVLNNLIRNRGPLPPFPPDQARKALEATAAIRQREKETGFHQPVIALTASVHRARCLAAGMDGHLRKPIQPQELDELIGVQRAHRRKVGKIVPAVGPVTKTT